MMTLWGSGGSSVIRGNMITIPIKHSLIYVEPIYITSGKNTFPELKMVIAAYDNRISIEPTLKEALDTLFRGTPSVLSPDEAEAEEPVDEENDASKMPSQEEQTDIDRITEAFHKVQEASKANDWEAFGAAMNELNTILDEINQAKE